MFDYERMFQMSTQIQSLVSKRQRSSQVPKIFQTFSNLLFLEMSLWCHEYKFSHQLCKLKKQESINQMHTSAVAAKNWRISQN